MAERPDFARLADAIVKAAGRTADRYGPTFPVRNIVGDLAADLARCWPPQVITRGDSPDQHITWAKKLLAEMSRQRLDDGQRFAVDEAIVHLERAAALIADERWSDAPEKAR